jgi:putative hydrolase of the HAD superfamily
MRCSEMYVPKGIIGKMNNIKAIFFDYDGVMTIDRTGTQSICNYVSTKCCIDKNIFEKEYRKYNNDLLYGKTTHEKIWDNICQNLNKEMPISILYDSFENTPINIEMHNFVKMVKRQNLKTALITDNKMDRIKIITEKYELNKIFDVIIVSSEIGFGKDNNKIFEIVLDKIGIKPNECIFIDNQKKNLIIPQEMGINTIFFDDDKKDLETLKNEIKKYGINI